MSTDPVSIEKANDVRNSLLGTLIVLILAAVMVFFAYSWVESRNVASITILATPQSQIAVDVRGAVSTPGVVYLQPGSRLIDVINSTGGLTSNADASLVNLSSRVADGQMIVIPTVMPEQFEQSGIGLININTASVEDLKQLPGIGDVLAQRIVTYREFNGPFQSVDEIENVEGVSTSLIESIRPLVTVSGND